MGLQCSSVLLYLDPEGAVVLMCACATARTHRRTLLQSPVKARTWLWCDARLSSKTCTRDGTGRFVVPLFGPRLPSALEGSDGAPVLEASEDLGVDKTAVNKANRSVITTNTHTNSKTQHDFKSLN